MRRLHPEKSLLDQPTEHGIYSLELKQELLDKLNDKQIKTKESAAISEPDSSTGLSSRLDKVKITADADDLLNGNVSAKSDGNGNKSSEKTIVVKDKPSSRSTEVTNRHYPDHITTFIFRRMKTTKTVEVSSPRGTNSTSSRQGITLRPSSRQKKMK